MEVKVELKNAGTSLVHDLGCVVKPLHYYRAVARLIDLVEDGTPFEVAHAFGG